MTARPHFLPADLFGLDPLARLALSERPRPRGLGGLVVPGAAGAIPEPPKQEPGQSSGALAEIAERAELAELLTAQLEPLGAHPAVHEACEKLGRPDSACVVTGQQPGLAGGPLLHLHKALHAVRLAAELERTWNRPVVAVFWNHGDDHDLSEGQYLWLRNKHHDPCRLVLPGLGSGRRSFASVQLDEQEHQLEAFEQSVRATLSRGEEAVRPLDLFLPRAGESLERAFTRVWTRLTGHLGLLVLEASALRPLASRALARMVTRDLETPLKEAQDRLRSAGLEGPSEPSQPATAWLFGEADGNRRALRSGGDGFRYDGEPGSRTGVELAAEIAAQPKRFSAGALLRTVVQDTLLPNAATVGGFGELGYWARTPELRSSLGLPPPVFVPRAHVTLTTPAVRRAMKRAGVQAHSLLKDPAKTQADARQSLVEQAELARGPKSAKQPNPASSIRKLATQLKQALADLRPAISEVDRGLSARSRRTAADVTGHLESLAKRVERATRNQHGRQDRHIRHARSLLCPLDRPQERLLTTLQTTIELEGTDWIDDLLHWIEPFPTEHLVLDLAIEPAEDDEPE